MVTPQSPSRHMFNGLDEDLIYNEAKFAHEINDKMKVPKRIKATGEYSDEDLLLSNQNGIINSWNYHDKIDMNVPDRIVVLGHDQHMGTRSTPREIVLENSILPKNPAGMVRVQTPPRTITLNDHHFPTASDENSSSKLRDLDLDSMEDFDDDESRPPPYVRANGEAIVGFHPNDANSVESDSQYFPLVSELSYPIIFLRNIELFGNELTTGGTSSKRSIQMYNGDTSIISQREGTPIGDLTPHEEILYLRRQLAKLNRRVLNIEISNEQRIQREKIVYCLGLAYFVMKAILWLNRN